MARYVWRDGAFRDPESGKPMPIPERAGPCVPQMIIPDIPDYQSPVTGEVISGRRQRRHDLEKHNCVEWEPSLSPTKGRFKNPHFMARRGIRQDEGR